jgi:hypothetical protein
LSASSQELTLFQDSERNSGRGQFPQGAAPEMLVAAAPTAPAMVLKGIYRFGDTYHVSLQSDQGATYKATWQQGQQNGVSVGGYQIDGIEDRTVMLSLPAGVNCQQNPQSGSNCIGRSQVALSFAESEPVSARQNGGGNRGATISFRTNGNDNNNFGGLDADRVRALLEAARSGDDRAQEAARNAIREAFGNRGGGRGRGGNGGGGGGRGGFGGDDD